MPFDRSRAYCEFQALRQVQHRLPPAGVAATSTSLATVLQAGNVSEAYEGASQLKEELLGLLRTLED